MELQDGSDLQTAWRGNRRSSFAQEFHASEREKQTQRVSLPLLKGSTPPDNHERDKSFTFADDSSQPQRCTGLFTLGALKELKVAFDSLEAIARGKLDKETFIRACLNIEEVTSMSENELEQLFMKVDVNNVGLVDWNDFSSFILLQQLSREDGVAADFAAYAKVKKTSSKSLDDSSEDSDSEKEEENVIQSLAPRCHKTGNATILRPSNIIEKIILLGAIQTYVTCTQDGFLKLWHTDSLKLLRTQENGSGAWISDIASMAQQPLAAFSMDRSITFYDTGRLSFDVLGRIGNLENIPMCGTWVRTVDNDKLLYGDDDGLIHIFNFTDEWGGENPKVAPGIADHLLPGMSEEQPWRVHTSWVTRLMYLKHSSSLLTGSLDSQLIMLDLEKQRKKWSAKEHCHGIYALTYGRTLNFIATCGLERHINIWNPFTAKIMGTLSGHQAPVVDVVVNDQNNQVISVASDSVIKIWDMRNNKCMQTILEKPNQKSLDPPVVCRLLYDHNKNVLLAGGSSLEAWKQKGSSEAKVKRTCSVLYSNIFHQVVVGEEVDSIVTVWNIENGTKTFSFSDARKKTKMSAMSFDSSGRRLLVGGQDGRVSMWNFNNGQCLKEFRGFGQNEVSCVSCLEEAKVKFVAAGGWNGKVCIWGDGPKEYELVEHTARGHSDDVICMTVFPPNCFATGGYDGKVIVWKVDGMIRCVLHAADYESHENLSNPIMNLIHLPLEKVLAGVTAHGYLYFWRVPEAKPIYEVSLGHLSQPGPMCTGSHNQVLFTSDIKGYVKAWSMKEFDFTKATVDSKLAELFCFRAHHETIVSMIYVDEKELLITASIFSTCRLWTEAGIKIGQFGQPNAWDLRIPETWASKTPSYVTNIPLVRDVDSISSSSSSFRISSSAGTSGSRSSSSRQMSRGSIADSPLDLLSVSQGKTEQNSDQSKPSRQRTSRGSLSEVIVDILEGGPPYQRLDSWFKPLQLAYSRQLPVKNLKPFGSVIPSNLSFSRRKPQEDINNEKFAAALASSRRKTKIQESPPRLVLPRFRLNQTAQTFSTVKSETNSPKSLATTM